MDNQCQSISIFDTYNIVPLPSESVKPVCFCACNDSFFIAYNDASLCLYSCDSISSPLLSMTTKTTISSMVSLSQGDILVTIQPESGQNTCFIYWDIHSHSSSSSSLLPEISANSALLVPPTTADPGRATSLALVESMGNGEREIVVVCYESGLITFFSTEVKQENDCSESPFMSTCPLSALIVLTFTPFISISNNFLNYFNGIVQEISVITTNQSNCSPSFLIGIVLNFGKSTKQDDVFLLYDVSFSGIGQNSKVINQISQSELIATWIKNDCSFGSSLSCKKVYESFHPKICSFVLHNSKILTENSIFVGLSVDDPNQKSPVFGLFFSKSQYNFELIKQVPFSNSLGKNSVFIPTNHYFPNSCAIISPHQSVSSFLIPNHFFNQILSFSELFCSSTHYLAAFNGVSCSKGLLLLVGLSQNFASVLSPIKSRGQDDVIVRKSQEKSFTVCQYFLHKNLENDDLNILVEFFNQTLIDQSNWSLFASHISLFVESNRLANHDESSTDLIANLILTSLLTYLSNYTCTSQNFVQIIAYFFKFSSWNYFDLIIKLKNIAQNFESFSSNLPIVVKTIKSCTLMTVEIDKSRLEVHNATTDSIKFLIDYCPDIVPSLVFLNFLFEESTLKYIHNFLLEILKSNDSNFNSFYLALLVIEVKNSELLNLNFWTKFLNSGKDLASFWQCIMNFFENTNTPHELVASLLSALFQNFLPICNDDVSLRFLIEIFIKYDTVLNYLKLNTRLELLIFLFSDAFSVKISSDNLINNCKRDQSFFQAISECIEYRDLFMNHLDHYLCLFGAKVNQSNLIDFLNSRQDSLSKFYLFLLTDSKLKFSFEIFSETSLVNLTLIILSFFKLLPISTQSLLVSYIFERFGHSCTYFIEKLLSPTFDFSISELIQLLPRNFPVSLFLSIKQSVKIK
ncbi:hypothetical protein RCL1_001112 [Eukaryota sp. TZLM3-RCL]